MTNPDIDFFKKILRKENGVGPITFKLPPNPLLTGRDLNTPPAEVTDPAEVTERPKLKQVAKNPEIIPLSVPTNETGVVNEKTNSEEPEITRDMLPLTRVKEILPAKSGNSFFQSIGNQFEPKPSEPENKEGTIYYDGSRRSYDIPAAEIEDRIKRAEVHRHAAAERRAEEARGIAANDEATMRDQAQADSNEFADMVGENNFVMNGGAPNALLGNAIDKWRQGRRVEFREKRATLKREEEAARLRSLANPPKIIITPEGTKDWDRWKNNTEQIFPANQDARKLATEIQSAILKMQAILSYNKDLYKNDKPSDAQLEEVIRDFLLGLKINKRGYLSNPIKLKLPGDGYRRIIVKMDELKSILHNYFMSKSLGGAIIVEGGSDKDCADFAEFCMSDEDFEAQEEKNRNLLVDNLVGSLLQTDFSGIKGADLDRSLLEEGKNRVASLWYRVQQQIEEGLKDSKWSEKVSVDDIFKIFLSKLKSVPVVKEGAVTKKLAEEPVKAETNLARILREGRERKKIKNETEIEEERKRVEAEKFKQKTIKDILKLLWNVGYLGVKGMDLRLDLLQDLNESDKSEVLKFIATELEKRGLNTKDLVYDIFELFILRLRKSELAKREKRAVERKEEKISRHYKELPEVPVLDKDEYEQEVRVRILEKLAAKQRELASRKVADRREAEKNGKKKKEKRDRRLAVQEARVSEKKRKKEAEKEKREEGKLRRRQGWNTEMRRVLAQDSVDDNGSQIVYNWNERTGQFEDKEGNPILDTSYRSSQESPEIQTAKENAETLKVKLIDPLYAAVAHKIIKGAKKIDLVATKGILLRELAREGYILSENEEALVSGKSELYIFDRVKDCFALKRFENKTDLLHYIFSEIIYWQSQDPDLAGYEDLVFKTN